MALVVVASPQQPAPQRFAREAAIYQILVKHRTVAAEADSKHPEGNHIRANLGLGFGYRFLGLLRELPADASEVSADGLEQAAAQDRS